MPSKIDWPSIRAAYETGASKNGLARTFGVSVTAITAHEKKDGWTREGALSTNSTADVTTVDISEVPEVVAADDIAAMKAELEALRSQVAAIPKDANIPFMENRADVIGLYTEARLYKIAANQTNRQRKMDGFPPIEYDPADPRLKVMFEETIEKVLSSQTAEAGKHNLRTIKMAFPDKKQPGGFRLAALPIEANFNNEVANPGASIRHYQKKGWRMVKPARCMRGPCWAKAAVGSDGRFAFSGYCTAEHAADDPVVTAKKIGGVSVRMIRA